MTFPAFDAPRIDPRPWRLRVMHEAYGRDPEHTCGQCRHLVVKRWDKSYFKCDLTRMTNGPGTDWRKSWEACSRFEEGEGERE